MRSRVLFRSDRGHYRRREAPDPQRLQRGRGFVHLKACQAFPEIGRQVRRREQTAVRASRWRRRSCRALPDAPAPPKLRDRVRGWDLEFESGLLQRRVCLSPGAAFEGRESRLSAGLCAAGLATGSAETRRLGQDHANGRQYLCRAIFQYRSAADGVGENATPVPIKSGCSPRLDVRRIAALGPGSTKAQHVPGKRQA